MSFSPAAAALGLALALGSATAAETVHLAQAGHGHGAHGAPAGAASAESPSTKAFRATNERMHAGMDIPFTGDADIDFARGMIPHHQGAIDMARIVIEHGTDAELRRLAQEIIAAQEGEIAFLRAWLAARGQ